MLVITIIGVLMMVLLPQLTGRSVDSRIASTRIGLAAVAAALARCEMDVGVIPLSCNLLLYSAEGLVPMGIVYDTSLGKFWNGPNLAKKQLIDAWKQPFVYKDVTQTLVSYKLYSVSPNRQDNNGGDDDVLFVP